MKRALAAIVVIAAIAAIWTPVASASSGPPGPVFSPNHTGASTPQTASASGSGKQAGFDWGDAAVGAVVTLAAIALCGGTVLLVRHGRRASQPAIS
jgi:hypothetical protein